MDIIDIAIAKALSSNTVEEQKGQPNGIATLNETGHVPEEQLPSYVDDVIEYPTFEDFPATGETGKIYIDISTGDSYRWSGTQYVKISSAATEALLDEEIERAIEAETQIQNNLTEESNTREAKDTELNTKITEETELRTSADSALSTSISNEMTARTNADTTLQTNIESEASQRTTADAALQTTIENEASLRTAADNVLQTNIDNEATSRSNADTTLQTNIDNEVSARTTADTTLQTNIDNEASARSAADVSLQNNIDLKQDKLTAGTNISISEDNVISSKDLIVNVIYTPSEIEEELGTFSIDKTYEEILNAYNAGISVWVKGDKLFYWYGESEYSLMEQLGYMIPLSVKMSIPESTIEYLLFSSAYKMATSTMITCVVSNHNTVDMYAWDIPEALSGYRNDVGFITKTVENLTNYYKKSETYTQEEVNALIAAIEKFEVVVADELPTASASTMNKLYLIPAPEGSGDTKDEYITIRSGSEGSYTYSWEKIGNTRIDLSNYYTKDQTYSRTESDGLLNTKQDILTAGNGITLAESVISAKNDNKTITFTDNGELQTVIGGSHVHVDETVIVDGAFEKRDEKWYRDILTWAPFENAGESLTCTLVGTYITPDSVTHNLNGEYVLEKDHIYGGYIIWLDEVEFATSISFFPADHPVEEDKMKAIFKGGTLLGASLICTVQEQDKYEQIGVNYVPVDNTTIIINDDNKLQATSQNNAYNYINQISDYLFEVQYSKENIDYGYANDYFQNIVPPNSIDGGACTGVVKDGKVLRQLDWYYNDECEFIVRTVADPENEIHASVGIASGIKGLTRSIVESGEYNRKFKMVPFIMTDGINDAGIYVQTNVVQALPNGFELNKGSDRDCCITMLARYILDKCTTLAEVRGVFNSVHIYDTPAVTYGYHFLVAKNDEWMIVEITENGFEYVDSNTSSYPYGIMTNFRSRKGDSIVLFNESGLDWNSVEEYGLGLERFENAIQAFVEENPKTLETLRTDLQYTKLYTDEYKTWKTEYCGETDPTDTSRKLTVTDARTEPYKFNSIFEENTQKYNERTREDGQGTWQTTHSAIYDLSKKSFEVCIQERFGEKFEFSLKEVQASITNWTAMEGEDGFIQNKPFETLDNTTIINDNGKLSVSNDLLNTKQDTLVSGTNIKTVNGNNVLGSGNIAITTYQPIPLTPYSQTTQEVGKWRTKTMEMFMADIIADPSAVKGMAYLSTVGTATGDHDFYNSDIMPTCCELKVEIMQVETSGETGIHKIAKLTATSTNNEPYIWTRDLEGGTSPWEPFYNFPWRAGNGAISKISVGGTDLSPNVGGVVTLPNATSSSTGIVQPDNSTITIDDGVITAIADLNAGNTAPTDPNAKFWYDTSEEESVLQEVKYAENSDIEDIFD